MPLLLNLRELEEESLELQGTVPVVELDLGHLDEVIHLREPLTYDVIATLLEDALLVEGSFSLPLHCDCVRCLKPFTTQFDIPTWTLHLPLTGEDQVSVVNDCVDLTPYLREDILLGIPQHPLCEQGCPGLPLKVSGIGKQPLGSDQTLQKVSAWDELNKLKL